MRLFLYRDWVGGGKCAGLHLFILIRFCHRDFRKHKDKDTVELLSFPSSSSYNVSIAKIAKF